MDNAALMEMVRSKKQALTSKNRTVKIKAGKTRIRVLPGWRKSGDGVFWQDFGQHFVKGTDGQVKAIYVCVDRTYGRPCSICTALEKALRSTSDDALVTVLGEAKAGSRILVNALMLDDADPNTPQILELAPSVFKGVLEAIESWGNVTDIATGREVIITREGTGLNTKYTVMPGPNATPVPPVVLTKLNDLDEYVKMESTEQEKRAISALNNVAGLLPAAEARDVPRTLLAAPTEVPASAGVTTATPIAAAPTPAPAVLMDSEIEDLLSGLPK